MRKKVLLAALSALALAACVNDETIEMNPGNALVFRASTENSTRSTIATSNSLNGFNVWAYHQNGADPNVTTEYMVEQEVTKNFIRSTSSVSQIYEMVEKNDPLVAIKENESLIILSYSAGNAGEALISAISRKFNVDANIVFGNVEIIANQAMGSLVVIISGELSDINQAVAYIRDAGVKVEVLKTC